MTAPKPPAPARPQGLAATTIGLRKADVANFEAAGVLRPGASPPEVRSEVIALGYACMLAGGRVEAARVVLLPPEGPSPLSPQEEAEEVEAFRRYREAKASGWPAGKPKPSERNGLGP